MPGRSRPKLNLNYGLRYDYAQSAHDSNKDLTSFNPNPGRRLRHPGRQRRQPLQPLQGVHQPTRRRILRAQRQDQSASVAGIFYDSVYMLSILNLRGTTDGGALGIGNNLAGAAPVVTAQATPTNAGGGAVISSGQCRSSQPSRKPRPVLASPTPTPSTPTTAPPTPTATT
jgi:hypothetical protein